MHCEESESLLGQLVFDDLHPEVKKDLRAHVEACEKCRALAGDMRVAAKLLTEGVHAGSEPKLSEERKERLKAAAASPSVRKVSARGRSAPSVRWGLLAKAAAAVLVVAIAAAIAIPNLMGSKMAYDYGSGAGVETTDVVIPMELAMEAPPAPSRSAPPPSGGERLDWDARRDRAFADKESRESSRRPARTVSTYRPKAEPRAPRKAEEESRVKTKTRPPGRRGPRERRGAVRREVAEAAPADRPFPPPGPARRDAAWAIPQEGEVPTAEIFERPAFIHEEVEKIDRMLATNNMAMDTQEDATSDISLGGTGEVGRLGVGGKGAGALVVVAGDDFRPGAGVRVAPKKPAGGRPPADVFGPGTMHVVGAVTNYSGDGAPASAPVEVAGEGAAGPQRFEVSEGGEPGQLTLPSTTRRTVVTKKLLRERETGIIAGLRQQTFGETKDNLRNARREREEKPPAPAPVEVAGEWDDGRASMRDTAKRPRVTVQARFLEVRDSFLEDIGVEFADLPDATAARPEGDKKPEQKLARMRDKKAKDTTRSRAESPDQILRRVETAGRIRPEGEPVVAKKLQEARARKAEADGDESMAAKDYAAAAKKYEMAAALHPPARSRYRSPDRDEAKKLEGVQAKKARADYLARLRSPRMLAARRLMGLEKKEAPSEEAAKPAPEAGPIKAETTKIEGAAAKAFNALNAKLKKMPVKSRADKIAAIEAALPQVRYSKKQKTVENMLRREKDAVLQGRYTQVSNQVKKLKGQAKIDYLTKDLPEFEGSGHYDKIASAIKTERSSMKKAAWDALSKDLGKVKAANGKLDALSARQAEFNGTTFEKQIAAMISAQRSVVSAKEYKNLTTRLKKLKTSAAKITELQGNLPRFKGTKYEQAVEKIVRREKDALLKGRFRQVRADARRVKGPKLDYLTRRLPEFAGTSYEKKLRQMIEAERKAVQRSDRGVPRDDYWVRSTGYVRREFPRGVSPRELAARELLGGKEEKRLREQKMVPLMDQVERFFADGEFAQAEKLAKEVVKLDPTNYRADKLVAKARKARDEALSALGVDLGTEVAQAERWISEHPKEPRRAIRRLKALLPTVRGTALEKRVESHMRRLSAAVEKVSARKNRRLRETEALETFARVKRLIRQTPESDSAHKDKVALLTEAMQIAKGTKIEDAVLQELERETGRATKTEGAAAKRKAEAERAVKAGDLEKAVSMYRKANEEARTARIEREKERRKKAEEEQTARRKDADKRAPRFGKRLAASVKPEGTRRAHPSSGAIALAEGEAGGPIALDDDGGDYEAARAQKLLDTLAPEKGPRRCHSEIELRMYDVRDLARSATEHAETLAKTGHADVDEPAGAGLGRGGLGDLIRERVRPTEWAAELGTSVEERGGRLVVMQKPEVHKLIEEKLDSLRAPRELTKRERKSLNKKVVARLEREKVRLEEKLQHQNRILRKLMQQGVPVNDIVPADVVQPATPIDAKILAVRSEVNLVMVSAGSDAGVKKGHRFTIYRADEYVGKVEVENVFDDMASARILTDWTRQPIRENDGVSTSVYGEVRSKERMAAIPNSPRMLAAGRLMGLEKKEVASEEAAKPAPGPQQFLVLSRGEAQTIEKQAQAKLAQQLRRQLEAARGSEERVIEEIEPEPEAEVQAEEAPPEESEAAAKAPPAPLPPVNPFVMTAKDRFSTFAMDVDTASYTIARKYIRGGYRPPARLVRMEEFVNAFDYNYPKRSRDVFDIHSEGMPSPFGKTLQLLKIGVQARIVGREGRRPAHLVFVIDTSGSMEKPDRIPLVKYALGLLVNELAPVDLVTVVTYGTRPRLVLEGVSASKQDEIIRAIRSLQCGGSTNMIAGLRLGYEQAERGFRAGAVNRVILCSDGVANVGASEAEEILKHIERFRDWGITLTVAGFGAGSYNDRMLEKLANSGDGHYIFVDSRREARRVFVEELGATLHTVAKDAKIQVEFDPKRVRRYRLVGYENRDIADKDFRNDAIDAGEVGSGQSVTALYEIELHEIELLDRYRLAQQEAGCRAARDIGTVYVRYRNILTGEVEEISHRLREEAVAARRRPKVAERPRLYLAACVAEFAEILRLSEHAADGNLGRVERLLVQVAKCLPLDRKVRELAWLVRRAKGLARAE